MADDPLARLQERQRLLDAELDRLEAELPGTERFHDLLNRVDARVRDVRDARRELDEHRGSIDAQRLRMVNRVMGGAVGVTASGAVVPATTPWMAVVLAPVFAVGVLLAVSPVGTQHWEPRARLGAGIAAFAVAMLCLAVGE